LEKIEVDCEFVFVGGGGVAVAFGFSDGAEDAGIAENIADANGEALGMRVVQKARNELCEKLLFLAKGEVRGWVLHFGLPLEWIKRGGYS
jgi:hypothetical protein